MIEQLNRRTFLGASLLALCIPSKLFAADNSNEVVLRFAALSDVHYDRSHNDSSAERVRFGKALRFMNEFSSSQPYDKFDALVVAGDFSNHGVIEELGPFKKTMDDNLKPTTRRILCMGNHEYYGGNRELWEQTFGTKANRRQELNGYQFITVAPEKGTCNENDYVYAREWLEENIQAAIAADPTKPVFVVQHYHVYQTVYGSASLPRDFHAGVKDFADILNKYPQVIHISGHSHIPSFDPRAIWQGGFTAIGTGSMSYFALLLYERARNIQPGSNVNVNQAGAFLIFEVYKDNTIRVRLYDVISDSFLDREYVLVDPTNVDKYVYTNQRFEESNNPTWSADAKAEIVDLAPEAATVRFTQALDENCVVSYRIEASVEESGTWKRSSTYEIWSDYFMKTPVDAIEYDVLGLQKGSKYKFEIYALGAFQKETLQPLTLEFKTPDASTNVDRSQPCPKGDFIDVSFDPQNGAINAPDEPNFAGSIRTVGEGVVVVDPTLGNAASLNGKDQAYLIPFSGVRASAIRDEFSIGVKFRMDLTKKVGNDPISIFGSTENGGVGFEYYAEKKQLYVRCWLNDKYEDLGATIELPDDAVAFFTYDGKETRLYVNGKVVAQKERSGKFRFTQNVSARAFCIGGDVCPGMSVRWFFSGVISNARVYTYALTPEQVHAVSNL